jgi:hypothetical protein
MFAEVDNEGKNQYLLLQEITDHKKDNSTILIRVYNGQTIPK